MRMLLPLLALACRSPAADEGDPVLDLTPPELTELTWVCDTAAERWTLVADASSWTSGGWLWLTIDGAYVEKHRVPSIGAEPDGSADSLRLRLDVARDWRLVEAGFSTAWPCAQVPEVLLQLLDPQDQEADCATLGDDAAIWDLVEGVSCESAWPAQE